MNQQIGENEIDLSPQKKKLISNGESGEKGMFSPGTIIKVLGPVVQASHMRGSQMYESVRVGNEELIGEIITLDNDIATIQVYEETTGIIPGEPVSRTGFPLSVELGPGLLGTIYDGIQRPLEIIKEKTGDMIQRGVTANALNRETTWLFTPLVHKGDTLNPGDTIGSVQESLAIIHYIKVPPTISGVIEKIVSPGTYSVSETIATLHTPDGPKDLSMMQKWPVRDARPIIQRFDPVEPLITGQRIIDTLFPLVKGGTAAIPGPFGSGKTVVQHQLAKWVNADIIVYVGCGERGNEMAEVLTQFPGLIDPRYGQPLINRMVLIANTSNMPVAAREASIYTGITIAEYYRDMGYDVALMADSTSRWAEAMREISGRLEEMPGEEGYPAYLSSRLAEFYERAGKVLTHGREEKTGTISIIGAVSPPGGDFSEPVTQNTLRIVKVFWALDAELAYQRHFPAINWLMSYSLYAKVVDPWWEANTGKEWQEMKLQMMEILQKESEIQEIIRLVGPETLPEEDKLSLIEAELLRESYLRQFAFHPVDTFSSPKKQYLMLMIVFKFFSRAQKSIDNGALASEIRSLPIFSQLSRMGTTAEEDLVTLYHMIEETLDNSFQVLGGV